MSCATAMFATLILTFTPQDGQAPPTSTAPAATQAASAPSGPRTARRPREAEILAKLIGDQEGRQPILPQPIGVGGGANAPSRKQGLLLEGTIVRDRPGRIVRVGDHSEFVFQVEDEKTVTLSLELLKCSLLEVMENEASGGNDEFQITAEVTTYNGENQLLLRKVLRRVKNNNLSP